MARHYIGRHTYSRDDFIQRVTASVQRLPPECRVSVQWFKKSDWTGRCRRLVVNRELTRTGQLILEDGDVRTVKVCPLGLALFPLSWNTRWFNVDTDLTPATGQYFVGLVTMATGLGKWWAPEDIDNFALFQGLWDNGYISHKELSSIFKWR